MNTQPRVSAESLRLDPEAETERVTAWIRDTVFHNFHRKGAVIGVSGGIDSSVVAFLCVRALGSGRVQILFTPESDSSPDSLRLGNMVAEALNARSTLEDISAVLKGARCYERRDESVRLGRSRIRKRLQVQNRVAGISRTPDVIRFFPSSSSPRMARPRKSD